jgi:hypothetical protein
MGVDSRHNEYTQWESIWRKTRDGIAGQEKIKDMGTEYLPRHDGQSEYSYNAYKYRAQYINYSGRTLNIFIGQIFRKNPQGIDNFKDYADNIDLSGSSFNYFSRDIAREVMTVNRAGVLVNYSDSQQRPYLTKYLAENIINWKTEIINTIEQLTMIILEGVVNDYSKDEYKPDYKKVWKKLYLEDGICKSIEYEAVYDDNTGMTVIKEIPESLMIPLKNGKPLNFIPFYFVTSNGITWNIDKPVMTDFVNINIGHYINSADNENRLHYTGAATAILKAWDESKVFPIGGAASFPAEGGAEWMTVSSDAGLKEEMRHKEEQLAALGSSVLSGKGRYVASAETASITSQGEYATLADISNSLSDCMTVIMEFFMEWAGKPGEIRVEYNTDFEVEKINPQMLTALMGAVQSGRMSEQTFFYNLQGYEMYPEGKTFEEEQAEIEETEKKNIEKNDKKIAGMFNETMKNNQDQNNNDDSEEIEDGE